MKLTFIGADHEVTGSCHMLEACGLTILVDHGMQQGRDEFENAELSVDASKVDMVLVTHAHMDHTGLLPLLYKEGFSGQVFSTCATEDLCSIMLADSAHIQQMEAEWKNRKRQRQGLDPVAPIYTMDDVKGVMSLFHRCDYEQVVTLYHGEDGGEITAVFHDVGHLLGSSSITISICENQVRRSILFSGDVGNIHQPLIRDPQPVEGADYLVIESTYGNRLHEMPTDYIQPLVDLLTSTFNKGGNLVIPSFAVGRTQEMLYYFREIQNRRLIADRPSFPVYVDSPLAVEATKIFLRNQESCYDEEAVKLLQQGINPIDFPGLKTSVTTEESKAINFDEEPKVILSASGMCEAGRIRHHLKHNLWRPESTILFVGYQAEGTLGRTLLNGADKVKLFGEEIVVKATIKELPGVSGHADQKGLLNWVSQMSHRPEQVFVVHGEDEVTDSFAALLSQTFPGMKAKAPYSGSSFDLAEGRWLYEAPARPIEHREAEQKAEEKPSPEKQPGEGEKKVLTSSQDRLQRAMTKLSSLAESSRLSAKQQNRLADQINSLLNKWRR